MNHLTSQPPIAPAMAKPLKSRQPPASVQVMPNWAHGIYDEIAATLLNPDFPCVFAREAFKRNAIHFCWADSPTDQHSRELLTDDLERYLSKCAALPPIESLLITLAVVFKPVTPMLTLEQYHRQAWQMLQALHDHDAHPWPKDMPTDPDEPHWSFCFAGTPVFINVSAPAHRVRQSRNLCGSLVLIMQPRANFDLVAGINHPNGEEVRKQIRERMATFDQLEAPEELGTYGDQTNREWHQYVLKESNEPRADLCPLRINR